MSAPALDWLRARATDVPTALEARMERAIDDTTHHDDIPNALADAARTCLRDALTNPDSRDAALHLLAADALITYACEAAAEHDDAGALRGLARAWTPDRLSHLIDGSTQA